MAVGGRGGTDPDCQWATAPEPVLTFKFSWLPGPSPAESESGYTG